MHHWIVTYPLDKVICPLIIVLPNPPPPPPHPLLTYRWTEQHRSPSCWPFGWWWRCWCCTVGDTMYGAAWGNICLYLVDRILRRRWWVDWIKGRQNRTCLTPGLDQLFNCCWQNIQGYYRYALEIHSCCKSNKYTKACLKPKPGQCLTCKVTLNGQKTYLSEWDIKIMLPLQLNNSNTISTQKLELIMFGCR